MLDAKVVFCGDGVDEGLTSVSVTLGDVWEGIEVSEGVRLSDGRIVGEFVFVGREVIPGVLLISIISCVMPAPT